MFLVSVLRYALFILVPISVLLSTYLYLWPVFHLCTFPSPETDHAASYRNTFKYHTFPPVYNASQVAPFRLLALGDPQLEGESQIDPNALKFPNLSQFWKDAFGTQHNLLQRIRHSLHDLVDFYLDDIPRALEVWRKRLDHIGNDYYLGHVYRRIHWWTNPTHVTVLGDLVGSQWIADEEFEERGWRFWNRVFRHGKRVTDDLASEPSRDYEDTRILGEEAEAWKNRIINVAGNHDIGYAGDISRGRVERFNRVFGKVNYELRIQHPQQDQDPLEEMDKPVPELRIVVLNDMNLDTPASSKEMQDDTYEFLNKVITTSKDVNRPAHFTLLLTHIPMYKDAGVCVDPPFFDFFTGEFSNGVKEQNHLSRDASKGFLEGIFGMNSDPNAPGEGYGRHGLILTGHDHEGCDTYHYINQSLSEVEVPLVSPKPEWQARKWKDAVTSRLPNAERVPGLREITVRSMMGDFAGNTGLLSMWFDTATWTWKYEFVNCGMGTQHLWWIVHILNLITLGFALAYGILSIAQHFRVYWEDDIVKSESQPTFIQTGDLQTPVRIRRGTLTALKIPVTNRFVEEAIKGTELQDYLNTGRLDHRHVDFRIPEANNHGLIKKRSKRSMTIGGSDGISEFPKFQG